MKSIPLWPLGALLFLTALTFLLDPEAARRLPPACRASPDLQVLVWRHSDGWTAAYGSQVASNTSLLEAIAAVLPR